MAKVSIHYHIADERGSEGAVCQSMVLDSSQLTMVVRDVTCDRCLVLVGAQMLDTLMGVFQAMGKLAVLK
jgi:hypothetical protein